MSWELKSFDELGFIGRGKSRHRPRNDESLYGGEFPLIQTGDVKNANLYITEYSQTYSQKGLDQSKLWEPNTLCITIAANIADTTILGIQACFPDSIIGFVADENVCDVRFIKYHFDIVQKQMQMVSQGATQDNLSLEKLLKFKVPTPPLETQKRIASILSTYDDLIENNLKRIKLLEETAQNIYKEWFVNFRFPNYEHTEFDEESGLPKGWEKKSLNNFNCIYQFKEKVKPYLGEKEYLATANVEGINISERGEYFTFENRPSRAQHLAPQESVWFARMSKTYKVILFTKSSNSDILLSSGFVGFVPKKSQFLPFLFCLINNKNFFDIKDMFCTGSTQVSLNNESINKLIYVEPNEEIITEFGNKLYPLIEQINKLFELNQKLKEARDILLPRLMNRTIEV